MQIALATFCYNLNGPRPLHRIALEWFLIAGRQIIRPQFNKESTNENNTDIDRWVDARRLRLNGKPSWKRPLAGSR